MHRKRALIAAIAASLLIVIALLTIFVLGGSLGGSEHRGDSLDSVSCESAPLPEVSIASALPRASAGGSVGLRVEVRNPSPRPLRSVALVGRVLRLDPEDRGALELPVAYIPLGDGITIPGGSSWSTTTVWMVPPRSLRGEYAIEVRSFALGVEFAVDPVRARTIVAVNGPDELVVPVIVPGSLAVGGVTQSTQGMLVATGTITVANPTSAGVVAPLSMVFVSRPNAVPLTRVEHIITLSEMSSVPVPFEVPIPPGQYGVLVAHLATAGLGSYAESPLPGHMLVRPRSIEFSGEGKGVDILVCYDPRTRMPEEIVATIDGVDGKVYATAIGTPDGGAFRLSLRPTHEVAEGEYRIAFRSMWGNAEIEAIAVPLRCGDLLQCAAPKDGARIPFRAATILLGVWIAIIIGAASGWLTLVILRNVRGRHPWM